jgi:drug/metabolite transporter (DMT)-like permease
VLTGILFVALSGVAFASATVMVKLGFREGATLGALVALRLGVGMLVLGGFALLRGVRLRVPAGRWPAIWVMGALSSAVGLLLFGAAERIPASATTLILYAYPALVAGLSVALRRDRLNALKAVALVVGLTGVLLVLRAPVERLDLLGTGLALGASVALALYVLVSQRGAAGMAPAAAGTLILATATALYLPVAVAMEGADLFSLPEGWEWGLLVGVATGAGIALFLAGLARLGPIRASIGQLVGAVLVVAAVGILPLSRS